jgi:anti-sigma regulatory factor (Ser/Thr protein kinase)
MASPPPRSTVRVAGNRSGIQRAIAALDDFLAAQSFDSAAAWPLKVALDEVLSNVVAHAYVGRIDGMIDIEFGVCDGGEVEIVVVDDGEERDPLKASPPDTASSLDARETGGLGVYLVKQLADRVAYTRQCGRNRLVFGKRIGVAKPAAEGGA